MADGLMDEGKQTTINVQPGGYGNGYGNGWGGGWGYPGYGYGTIPNNMLPASPTGIVGTILGGLAVLGLFGGALGVANRNGQGNGSACATQRDLDYERDLTVANAENAQLKSQIYTDGQVNELRREIQGTTATQAVINAQTSGVLAVLQQQAAQYQAMQMNVLRPAVIKASEAVAASAATPAAASGTGTGS